MTLHARSFLDRATAARARLRVPALTAGVVDAEGVLTSAVVGTRRRDVDDPVTAADQWHIGSCGKSITAALWARLVEAGLTDWTVSMVDVFGAHPGWAGVTIEEVLLNRGGVPADLSADWFSASRRDDRPLTEQRATLAEEVLARPPVGVGTFLYSNLGYTIVGAAVERLLGEPFETALVTRLLAPLGITSAGFGPPPDVWGHGGRLRFAPVVLGRGRPIGPTEFGADNPAVMTSAGRLHLTLADWSRFLRLFLTGADSDVLSPTSVERMLRLRAGDRYAMGWAPAGQLGPVSFGQQGSNTYWAATALLDADRRRAAMVVVNDGRTSMLARTAGVAVSLLAR